MKAGAAFALAAALWAAGAGRDAMDDWVAETELPALVVATSDEVRARDGQLLRAYTVGDGLWRMQVTRDAVDDRFLRMLIAYEDRRFHRHSGVDPLALVRAAAQAARHGRIVSGGSTLTMQVARLLEDGPTGTLPGKLRQMRVALSLERRLDKGAILDLYLHLAPYGGNVEGVRAAALTWLGKEPARLTPAEAALLVALPQSPEARRPDRAPDAARDARDRVLARAQAAGVLSAEAARAASRDPASTLRRPMPQIAPHLADRLRSASPGRVMTTIDAALQARIESLVTRHMAGRDDRLSIAVMVADHASGEILASVGARSYGDGPGGFIDMTQAQRSPGSTLKPLVYALAFDRGLAHPETLILDEPVHFGTYAPQNFDGRFRGEVTVAEALRASLNIPVVRLTEALGPAHLMAALRRAGADPGLPGGAPGLALSLGGVGLTLDDLMQLYTALARGGEAVPLSALPPEHAGGVRVVSRASAWQVQDVLARLAPPAGHGRPGAVAWKTGTSYGHRDAWALGWDGRHVAGIWIGRTDGTPVPGAFGGDLAAPALFEALARARASPAPLAPPPPEALIVGRADLPEPLRRFGERAEQSPLDLVFPPDGARLALGSGVAVKLRGGTPPYTLMADGAVLATGLRRPVFEAAVSGPGFTTLTVIDGEGRSGRVSVELR